MDAEVRITPNEVILTSGVETADNDLETAKRKNDEIVKRVIALADKYKIKPEHVQTDYISIEPRYRDRYESHEIIGYVVQKTVVFTVKDISKFEALLSDILKVGGNHIHGIQFRTTDLKKYRDQARALAIKAAQEKAQNLAKQLGKRIGEPLTIREEASGWWSNYRSWWYRGGGQSQVSVSNYPNPYESEGAFAPGQITVNAKVTVSFELR